MLESTNSGNLDRLLNAINRNKSGLGRSLEKIASGRRLGRAGEDPASNAIAARLRSDIAALSQAVRNVETGVNFIRTAEGSLSAVSDLVARGKELAIQSSNGTLGDTERQILNDEFTQIKTEIDRIANSAEFNGQKLLDGSLSSQSPAQVEIQAGSGSGPANRISLNVVESVDTQSLGIDGTDISSASGALQSIGDLDKAVSGLTASRGKLGATGNRLIVTANGLGTQIETLTQSESVLADTDIAAEVSQLRNGLSLFQTSLKTLAVTLRNNEQATGRLLNFTI